MWIEGCYLIAIASVVLNIYNLRHFSKCPLSFFLPSGRHYLTHPLWFPLIKPWKKRFTSLKVLFYVCGCLPACLSASLVCRVPRMLLIYLAWGLRPWCGIRNEIQAFWKSSQCSYTEPLLKPHQPLFKGKRCCGLILLCTVKMCCSRC